MDRNDCICLLDPYDYEAGIQAVQILKTELFSEQKMFSEAKR